MSGTPARATGPAPDLKLLAALYALEASVWLAVVASYGSGARVLLALPPRLSSLVFLGAGLAALAALVIVVRRYRAPGAPRRFGLTVALNLVRVLLVLAIGEAAVRLMSQPTPRGLVFAKTVLLPHSWRDVAARNEAVLARLRAEGSHLAPDGLLGWVLGPDRRSADGLYMSSVEGIRSARKGDAAATRPSRQRVALVGDSFTFGLAKPRFAADRGDLRLLNAPLPTSEAIAVTPSIRELPFVELDPGYRAEEWIWRPLDRSYLHRFAVSKYRDLVIASRPADTPMLALNRAIVRSFVRQARAEGSLPLVLHFPSDRNFRALAKDSRWRSVAQTMLDDSGVPYTDMTPRLTPLSPAERFPADGRNHFAPAANAGVAACLRDGVQGADLEGVGPGGGEPSVTTHILGISAFYHDSAACLVRDGEIIAAAQEERFTRKKHDPGFPIHAVRYCLREGGVALRDLRYVAFYDKPLVKFERLLETYLSFAPSGHPVLRDGHAGLAQGEDVPEAPPAERAAGLDRRRQGVGASPAALRRAPRIPRRVGVLSVAVHDGGGAVHGRGRRVGHDVGLARRRQRADPALGDSLPPLDRPPVLGLHLLPRLQGQLRRVQGDGPGALRAPAVRQGHLRSSAGPEGGRHLPAQHGVLRLLHRAHDDERQVRRALRRPAPRRRRRG